LIRLDLGLADDGHGSPPRPVLFETNSTALAGPFNHTAGVGIIHARVLTRILSSAERERLAAPPDLLAMLFDWAMRNIRRLGKPSPRRPAIGFVEAGMRPMDPGALGTQDGGPGRKTN
jgi:hypothetical protein